MKNNYFIIFMLTLMFISLMYLPDNLRYKELVWVGISIILLFAFKQLKKQHLERIGTITYIINIILLIVLLLTNKFTNGSRAWFNFKYFSIQPSLFMNISLILISPKCKNIFKLLILYLVPMVLIFLEPDTGGVLIEGLILLVFLKDKLKKKTYYILILSILLLLILGLFIISSKGIDSYRINRILSFINKDNLQSTNALISIATGNTLYFPEMYNDFYIAYLLSNNINLIVPIIISTFGILFYLIKKNTLISKVVFFIILFLSWWNMAMNLGLIPIIGIPYPFISYGGSTFVTLTILLAISSNIHMDNYKAYQGNT